MAIYWPTPGEHLSSVFSPNGTLISVSTVPHCRISRTDGCLIYTWLYLGLPHFEGFGAFVDDRDVGTTSTDETHALFVGSQLDSSLSGHSVAGVEDSALWDCAEHGQVLQRHLGGSVLTCTQPSAKPCNETCNVLQHGCRSLDGGGFFLVWENSVRTFNNSFPVCTVK